MPASVRVSIVGLAKLLRVIAVAMCSRPRTFSRIASARSQSGRAANTLNSLAVLLIVQGEPAALRAHRSAFTGLS
jgi:hypothetical protein